MRYTWTVKTGDVWYAGTDSNVFLSLNGSDAVMKEVQIDDPNSINDWEKGDVNSGSVETQDLGDLQTGVLRSDQSGPGSGWYVDWVKIRNEDDGREWTAQVGAWSDHDGRDGRFRLKFTLSDPGDYDRIQKQKQDAAAAKAAKDAADKKAKADQDAAARDAQIQSDFDKQLADQQAQLDRELKKAQMEIQLAQKRAQLDQLKAQAAGASGTGTGTGTGMGTGMGGGFFRTFELFGMVNGNRVPLASVVSVDRNTGRAAVVPGGRVLVTNIPGEGFGLAGTPGAWQSLYGGQSPANFGLDPDKGVMGSDGMRGWALDSGFLSQVFGAGWRAAVYS